MIPKDIEKWDNNNWTRQVIYCRPSSGGAVGVVFVYAGRAYSKQSLAKPAEAAFVIKPIQGSAAPTKFAEHMLGKLAKTASPNSKPIPRRSLSGSGLVLTLKMFRDKETDTDIKKRWNAVFTHYDRADTFLIQETQVGIKELSDEFAKDGGVGAILSNKTLMQNLGKLFAADAIIGNGDRLYDLNYGNIIFKDSGQLCAIDSTTILTNFDSLLNSDTGIRDGMGLSTNTKTWVKNDIVGKFGLQAPTVAQQKAYNANPTSVTLAPAFGMALLFDVDTWWKTRFKQKIEFSARNDGNPLPPDPVWNQALIWFKEGVKDGIKRIDSKLSGINWLGIKSKYKNYVQKYGGDPNLDWTNLKIRRMYFKARKKGVSEEEALKQIQAYVAKKMPGL